jgi:hypothetical protein
MPRFVPRVDVTCRVCAASFALVHDLDPTLGCVTSAPSTCPHCAAPVRFVPAPSIGTAKSLLLVVEGARAYVRAHPTAEAYLRAHCARPEDVDAYVALVATLAETDQQRARVGVAAGIVRDELCAERARHLEGR